MKTTRDLRTVVRELLAYERYNVIDQLSPRTGELVAELKVCMNQLVPADQQAYVAQLEQYVTNVKSAVTDTFGKNPVACDGMLLVRTEDYNRLVEALNAKLEP